VLLFGALRVPALANLPAMHGLEPSDWVVALSASVAPLAVGDRERAAARRWLRAET
jgi:hypothetical protein